MRITVKIDPNELSEAAHADGVRQSLRLLSRIEKAEEALAKASHPQITRDDLLSCVGDALAALQDRGEI